MQHTDTMKYPVHLRFTANLTCQATFPDYPGIVVEDVDPEITLAKAKQVLIKTLSGLLKGKSPMQMPSACKLGQQLIEIPVEIAVRISAKNAKHQAVLDAYRDMK